MSEAKKEQEFDSSLREIQEKSENEKRIKNIQELKRKIDSRMLEHFSIALGTKDYTGVRQELGEGSIVNTPFASGQLMFALAMSGHQLIQDLAKIDRKQCLKSPKQEFEKLVETKVLSNLKILDLGCAEKPTFARVARALGADVYTVDVCGIDQNNSHKLSIEDLKKLRDIEKQKHIEVNLRSPEATNVIKEETGGNFDLVTEAHLATEGFHDGAEIADKLLKEGGIYYKAGWSDLDGMQFSQIGTEVAKIKE